MKSVRHKQATVRLNNTSVVIYYSHDGNELRYPTGIKINPAKDANKKFTHWDYKKSRLKLPTGTINTNQAIETMRLQQITIDNLLNTANDLLNKQFASQTFTSTDYLKIKLDELKGKNFIKGETGFFDYFNDFLERKRQHFLTRGNIISLKDYKSTLLLVEDYEHYKNIDISIRDIDNHWLEEFVQFMSIKHEKYYGEHKVSSKGEMAESTIKKRLDIVAEFFNYLKELKVVEISDVDRIKTFKKTIKKTFNNKETLDINEIHKLYKYEFSQPAHRQIVDLFVFLCLTGMRYQDLYDFDKRFIIKSSLGDGSIYRKAASKTGIDYNIPLCNIVIEILEKYNYELPKITDQYGNRAIKEALKVTSMFDDYTQIKDKSTKQYKRRYEAITLHKGRNSFITNLVDSTPLNELMKYTGHKKLSTLQSYIDTKRPVKMDYIKIFNI